MNETQPEIVKPSAPPSVDIRPGAELLLIRGVSAASRFDHLMSELDKESVASGGPETVQRI